MLGDSTTVSASEGSSPVTESNSNTVDKTVTPQTENNVFAPKTRVEMSLTDDQLSDNASTPGEWFWSEGVKGEGEKPEWYNEKTFGNIAEQAKAQPELRKKLGVFSGAPEKYDLTLSQEAIKDHIVDPENPVINSLKTFCKEHNMSQDGFTELLEGLTYFEMEAIKQEEIAQKEFHTEELKKLGDDSAKRVNELSGWLTQQNLDKSTVEVINKWMQTAEDVKALEAIRAKMGYSQIDVPRNDRKSGMERETELREYMNDSRYVHDTEYTKWVDKEFKEYWEPKLAKK